MMGTNRHGGLVMKEREARILGRFYQGDPLYKLNIPQSWDRQLSLGIWGHLVVSLWLKVGSHENPFVRSCTTVTGDFKGLVPCTHTASPVVQSLL